eukprot:gb/GEZN01009980.1/.p1 GENE.gb/GEZN01009980.1/~~gb/GEZN01009980.1/.p1  ORF type:complete len:209 (+),score=29.74 gb/GEZN01009980.1/:166-792(+)
MVKDGADWLHLDVMDGHFANNISLGVPIVAALRKHLPKAYLDCHLMVSNPEKWVGAFQKAGASNFTFHIEATEKPAELIKAVRDAGMDVGIALRPKTALETVLPYCKDVDMILLMTVEPGFSGQMFMPEVMPKVKALRAKFPSLNIEVDGGVKVGTTIEQCAEAGANVIVSGSGVFGVEDPEAAISSMRKTVSQSFPPQKQKQTASAP